MMMNDMIIIIN